MRIACQLHLGCPSEGIGRTPEDGSQTGKSDLAELLGMQLPLYIERYQLHETLYPAAVPLAGFVLIDLLALWLMDTYR